jgi:hypothetical protein
MALSAVLNVSKYLYDLYLSIAQAGLGCVQSMRADSTLPTGAIYHETMVT